MCGICGVVQVGGCAARGRSSRGVWSHDGRDDASRARRPWHVHRTGGRVRRRAGSSIVDVEGGHQPFCERGRHGLRRCRTASSTTTRDPRASSPRDGHRFRAAATPRSCRTCTRQRATASPQRLRGKFGVAVWDDRRRRAVLARDRLGVKPLYWARRRRPRRVRLRAQERARERPRPRRARLRGDRRLPRPSASSRHRTRRSSASASCSPGHQLVVDDGGVAERALLALPAARPRPARRAASSDYTDELLELLRGVGAAPADERRAARRDALAAASTRASSSRSWPTADRARQDLRVGFREDGEQNELDDAARRRKPLRHRPPRARALLPRRRPSTSPSSSGTSTSPSPTSPPSASSPSRSSRANTSRSRSPARARTNSSPGTESTGTLRRRRWQRLPRRCGGRSRRRSRGPRSLRAAGGRARSRRTPAERLIAMAVASTAATAPLLVSRPARGARRHRGAPCDRRRASASFRDDPLRDALPRRAARARPTTCSTTSTASPWPTRSRSACRSSTTTSSNGPPPSRRPQGPPADDQARPQGSRPRPPPGRIIDKPKIGFFNARSRPVARASGAGARCRSISSTTTALRLRSSSNRRRRSWLGHGAGSGESLFKLLILELWLQRASRLPPSSLPERLTMCGICGVVQVGGCRGRWWSRGGWM